MTDREPDLHSDPVVDVSAALGEAGHEVEELGFADIPDEGPVILEPGAPPGDVDDAADIPAVQFPTD